MAKTVNNDVLDAALNEIKNNANIMTVCSTVPTTRTEAVTTYALADIVMSGSDFTVGEGDTSGRKAAVAQKADVTVDASGVGNHIALCDGSRLLYVTEEGTDVRSNTCQAGSTGSTIVLDAGASGSDDTYNGYGVKITGGLGSGQSRIITDYIGSSTTAVVDTNWTTTPDGTSTFKIFGLSLVASSTVTFPTWDIEIADATP